MKLNQKFNFIDFREWVENFLPNFATDIRDVDIPKSFKNINSIKTIGNSDLNLRVFVIETETDPSNRKVSLAKDSFNLIKNYGTPNALIAYYSVNSQNWRISLLTSTPIWSEGKIITKLSNPKRNSYIIGENAKISTPQKFLITLGKVTDLNDLKERFSLEVVNKEFYEEISNSFSNLVGGSRTYKSKVVNYKSSLILPVSHETDNQKYLDFAVRLIGRVIFCWFLKQKKSSNNLSLMPESLLSAEATKQEDYYHSVLEPIFFEVLNKPLKNRKDEFTSHPFSQIPYLNGGLFSPQEDDFYDYIESRQNENRKGTLIPNSWFTSLFELLEMYNFTIDENTTFDEEISIDPEMLGRIFENLLAEINPQTGESARKSSGSYYTPRIIVDFMIEESLLLYLSEKTRIDFIKLKSLISYDLEDDLLFPLTDAEKNIVVDALGMIKILDPACGSGAFPIGILQKIVFILQQIDPNGQRWFKKQLQNTPTELKKMIEREFKEENFDYIRKIGVIKENIFGVDIQPIATEISRLRCFLTLIVEERIDDNVENRGIEPLPNLDFKFVTANTLVKLPSSKSQIGLFEDSKGIEELKEIRDLFFRASNFEREQLKNKFLQTQNRMLNNLLKEISNGVADLTGILTSWDPFNHKKSSWFDPEWMFGIKEGFDIVIGNPPYGADIEENIELYKKTYNKYVKNYIEIFKIFFASGLDLLKNKGILTYITPNTYLSQPRYLDLRTQLLKFEIIKIVNLGQEVFEGAIVPTCVSIIRKDNKIVDFDFLDATINNNFKGNLLDLDNKKIAIDEILKSKDFSLIQEVLNLINHYKLEDILNLKDAGIQYHRSGIGLKNKGGNDLFERIISSQKNHFKNSIQILYGKKISSYHIDKTPDEYFNLDYKEVLKKNESVSFSKESFKVNEKILWRQTAPYVVGALDTDSMWFRNTLQCGWIKDEFKEIIDIRYILALLNSKYLRFIYQKIVNEESGRAFPQVKLTHLKKLPIVLTDKQMQDLIVEQVKEVIRIKENNQDASEIINNINNIIYKLYNVSIEEITLIENKMTNTI
jgi:hypothetical protein